MNPLYELLELIATGKQEQADELFNSLVGERVSDILDEYRAELAGQLFATTEGEVIEEGEVKKANKAKKNAHIMKGASGYMDRNAKRRVYNSQQGKKDGDLKAIRRKVFGKHLLKKLTSESAEHLTELSKKTLGTYINKAANNMADTAFMSGVKHGRTGSSPKDAYTEKEHKRGRGIMNAVAKLRKESTEQLDELSKKTLGSYVNKAASSAFGAGHDAGAGKLGSSKSMKGYEKGTKRLAGVRKATAKLTKEEVLHLLELSKKTLGKYVKKATKQATSISATERSVSNRSTDAFLSGDTEKAAAMHKTSIKLDDKKNKRLKGISRAVDKLSEAMSDELKAKVKADMEKRRAAKNAALDAAKKEMDGWKPDKKDIRKIYKKED